MVDDDDALMNARGGIVEAVCHVGQLLAFFDQRKGGVDVLAAERFELGEIAIDRDQAGLQFGMGEEIDELAGHAPHDRNRTGRKCSRNRRVGSRCHITRKKIRLGCTGLFCRACLGRLARRPSCRCGLFLFFIDSSRFNVRSGATLTSRSPNRKNAFVKPPDRAAWHRVS